jgi:hypothetical protein
VDGAQSEGHTERLLVHTRTVSYGLSWKKSDQRGLWSPAKTLNIIHKINFIGTMKLTQKNVPMKVKNTELKEGKIVAQHCGPVYVTKWSYKK